MGKNKDKKDKKKDKVEGQEVKAEKKDKKEKKDKGEKGAVEMAIGNSTIQGVSNAKIVKTLEDKAKLDSTPAGDYFVDCPIGTIRVRKSEGAGRISFQLDGKQITRPMLYKCTKDNVKPDALLEKQDKEIEKANAKEESAGKKDKGEKKDKKDKKKDKGEKTEKTAPATAGREIDEPTAALLAGTYKKKQLLNILKEGQFFSKRLINEVKSNIETKKITGTDFIALLDSANGSEVEIDKISAIFAEV